MNLLQIRSRLIQETGRFDLVVDTTSYADKGADFFIQQGQRFLDLNYDFKKAWAEKKITLQQGEYLLDVSDLRSIERLRFESADLGVYHLTKVPIDQLREYYGFEALLATSEVGLPQHYSIVVRRQSLESNTEANESKTLIVVQPRVDRALDFYIEGYFWSAPLEDDTDVSYWSIEHPGTLIQAAMYWMERYHRNTEGMRDHLMAIREDLRMIDQDVAQQDTVDNTQMRDSW